MNNITKAIALSLLLSASAIAQSGSPPEGDARFTQAELDQMLAPIALYPDPLLSQVLMASSYPLEVVEADRWSRAHPELRGDAAVNAVEEQSWDPSVKSLVAFPQVLHTMDDKLDWTERLGDAFLAQQDAVMDTVQRLRHKARDAGNLDSNEEVTVRDDEEDIDIEPARPDVVYVPYYDPTVVYGSWWWPDYPPTYWSPWDGYGWRSGYAWGPAFIIGGDFFFGGWDWRHHGIWIRDRRHWFHHHGRDHDHDHDHDRNGDRGPHAWHHDPEHRRGVPYHNANLDRQFGRASRATWTNQHAPPARVAPSRPATAMPHPPMQAHPQPKPPAVRLRPPVQQQVPAQPRAPLPQRAPVLQRSAPAPQKVLVPQRAPVQRPPVRQPDPQKKKINLTQPAPASQRSDP